MITRACLAEVSAASIMRNIKDWLVILANRLPPSLRVMQSDVLVQSLEKRKLNAPSGATLTRHKRKSLKREHYSDNIFGMENSRNSHVKCVGTPPHTLIMMIIPSRLR
jgi:hypothetical protein